MWIDATVAASFVTDPKNSTVADKVGFALFPNKAGVENHGNWLWSWNLAIPASSKNAEAAKTFIEWATSKDYTDARRREGRLGRRASGHPHLALRERGLPGRRALRRADARRDERRRHHQADASTRCPTPAASSSRSPSSSRSAPPSASSSRRSLAGQSSVDDALAQAQSVTEREMRRAGY